MTGLAAVAADHMLLPLTTMFMESNNWLFHNIIGWNTLEDIHTCTPARSQFKWAQSCIANWQASKFEATQMNKLIDLRPRILLKHKLGETFGGPQATLHNILFNVVRVKKNTNTNQILMAKPISQWQDIAMNLALYWYSHASSFSIAVFNPVLYLHRGQWINSWHVAVCCSICIIFHADVVSTWGYQVPAQEKRSQLRQVYIMLCNLISQTLLSVKQLESR